MSVENAIFQVGYLERIPLGTSYPAIAHHVRRLYSGLPPSTEVVLDATGLGRRRVKTGNFCTYRRCC